MLVNIVDPQILNVHNVSSECATGYIVEQIHDLWVRRVLDFLCLMRFNNFL